MSAVSSFSGVRVPARAVAPRAARATTLQVLAKDSRIGKKPIAVPKGVTVGVDGSHIKVKGPKGELARTIPASINPVIKGDVITVEKKDTSRQTYQLHGLTRTLINNMVQGVTTGYERKLTLVGVGYRAKMDGRKLVLSIGFTHDVIVELPAGMNAAVTQNVNIAITGIDKEQVGNFAANLRRVSPPEPYGGKGIRFFDEQIKLKEGKAGAKGKK